MKVITKEILQILRDNQQKDYYGSQAKAMFVNGVFNPSNWNGGDGLVRQYFSDFNHGKLRDDTVAKEISFMNGNTEYSGDVIVTHTWFDDQNYVTVILRGSLYIDNQFDDDIEDVAYFSWYKSRGSTEVAKYNGKSMTEDEYLLVLNALVATGYEFELN